MKKSRHLLAVHDLTQAEILNLFKRAKALKKRKARVLVGRTLGLFFEKLDKTSPTAPVGILLVVVRPPLHRAVRYVEGSSFRPSKVYFDTKEFFVARLESSQRMVGELRSWTLWRGLIRRLFYCRFSSRNFANSAPQ